MNSLEFINQEIMCTQKEENIVKIQIESTPNDRELQSQLKLIQECLSCLQQIKCVLEAWEVVKNKSVDMHDVIHCSNLEVFNCCLYEKYQLTEEEYNKVKKALEVDNSVQWVEYTLKDFKSENN